MARRLSSPAFIIIMLASVIVGVALSMMAIIAEFFNSKLKNFKNNINISGARIILDTITIIVGLKDVLISENFNFKPKAKSAMGIAEFPNKSRDEKIKLGRTNGLHIKPRNSAKNGGKEAIFLISFVKLIFLSFPNESINGPKIDAGKVVAIASYNITSPTNFGSLKTLSIIGMPITIVLPKHDSKNMLASVAFEKLKIFPIAIANKADITQLNNPIRIRIIKE